MTAAAVLAAARSKGWRIATAESCTGGLLAGSLTDIPGSSDVFERGFVTYSNASKIEMLGVDPALISAHGAVSEEVAAAMARGAFARSEATLAVSTTGIAGPGGSEFKPEGRVCFGLASPAGVSTRTIDFGDVGRAQVRTAAVETALRLLATALDQAAPIS